eukprot:jgi/Chlat1/6519/Chrsp45S05999
MVKALLGQTEEVERALRQEALLNPTSFDALLRAGVWCTMHAPRGQLYGRAGRRCALEDAERFLARAIAARVMLCCFQ